MIAFQLIFLTVLIHMNTSHAFHHKRLRQYLTKRGELRAAMEKPMTDGLHFFQTTLKNGIRTTLVRDAVSEKASCSLGVRVGAKDDPPDYPGLAHFTEHAVFLGSDMFPVENEYKNFLNRNGGGSNAATSMESTVYKFFVNAPSLRPAANIFSQFFKQPLFNTDSISREILAVDSEDSKNRINDGRRMLQVMKNCMVSKCAYSKFSTGNVDTLAEGDANGNAPLVREQMMRFHRQYYKPSEMALAMVGPQSIDELKEIAEELFMDVDDRSSSPMTPATTLNQPRTTEFDEESDEYHINAVSSVYPLKESGIIVRVKPTKDFRDISIIWPMPPTKHLYRTNPCYLLSFLLGHKGPGSLFAQLQDRGWITGFGGGMRTQFVDFTLFEVSASLTEDGMEHWEDIAALVYAYIGTVIPAASDDDLTRVWNEIKAVGEIDFRFKSKQGAYEMAPDLVHNMLSYHMDHVLSAGEVLDDIDIGKFRNFLSMLTPSRSVTVLRDALYSSWLPDDGVEAPGKLVIDDDTIGKGPNRLEPWYNVPYHVEKVVDTRLRKWANLLDSSSLASSALALSIPQKNDFICYELASIPSDCGLANYDVNSHDCNDSQNAEEDKSSGRKTRSSPPEKLPSLAKEDSSDALKVGADSLWYSADEVFGRPKTVVHFLLRSDHIADGHVVNSLMASVYGQLSAQKLYPSAVAGLHFSGAAGSRGVGMAINGYTPRITQLVQTVTQDWGSLAFWREEVTAGLLEICRERLLRSLRSWVKDRPDSQAETLLGYALQEGVWLPSESITAAEQIDLPFFLRRVSLAINGTEAIFSESDATGPRDSQCATAADIITYVHGNISTEKSREIHRIIKQNIFRKSFTSASAVICNHEDSKREKTEGSVNKLRARLLPTGTHSRIKLPVFNADDPNSALVTHFQMGPKSPRTIAILLVLRRILGEPMFTELRTKEQLGYVVSLSTSSFGRDPYSIRGLTVRILSKRFGPEYMERKLGEFLVKQRSIFGILDDAEVSSFTGALVSSLLNPPTDYLEEAAEYWGAIIDERPFHWTELVISALKALTAEDVKEAAERVIFSRAHRTSMSVMLHAVDATSHAEKLSTGEERADDISSSPLEAFFPAEAKDGTMVRSIDELTAFRDSLSCASATHN